MNIMIPLGRGSRWQNNELRYCLRSVETYVTGWDKIYLVGEKPDWLKPNEMLIHLPFPEKPSARRKEQNIHRKILHYCEAVQEHQNFLFMNDDHFILKQVHAPDFPYHYKGYLYVGIDETPKGNRYRTTLKNTIKFCVSRGGNTLNFDTHAPIVYNTFLYKHVTDGVVFPDYGFAIKSLYCNVLKIQGEYYPDCKIGAMNHSCDLDKYLYFIRDRPYFSVGNQAIGEPLAELMESLYPAPSCFE